MFDAFSKANILEATRLTRAGRLTEAVALLQGGPPSPAPAPDRRHAGAAAPALESWGRSAQAGAEPPRKAGVLAALFDEARSLGPTGLLGRLSSGSHPAAPTVPPGSRFEALTFSNRAGSRPYKLYVPSRYRDEPVPVVVMLHGCKQSPDDFAAGTRMNELAEEQVFLVVYPGQTRSANASGCWNWFSPADQVRDQGEPSLIAGITRQVLRDFRADPARVYIAGLSAGGAAADIVAAAYPDLYAAVGIHSGLACGAATDLPSAFSAMKGTFAGPQQAGRIVPTIVFHGDADRTVHAVNADRIIAQTRTDTPLQQVVTSGAGAGGVGFTCTAHVDPDGRPVMEQWVLHGAGHAWSGGNPAGSYADSRGPEASREMLRFFGRHTLPSPG